MRRKSQRMRTEPTIALINVVFLMLIFFMVSGTLSQPLDPDLSLIDTRDLEGQAPPDALVIHADGRLSYRAEPITSATEFAASLNAEDLETLRLVPDRALDAADLVSIARELRIAGAKSVVIVTERALK